MSTTNVAASNAGTDSGGTMPRFKSKKALAETVRDTPANVWLSTTSFHAEQNGTDWHGPLVDADRTQDYSVVGPDPYTDRRWYATIRWTAKGWKVT